MRRATVWPMTSPTRHVPGLEIGSHASHLYGGIVAYWVAENATGTRTEPKTRRVNLSSKKLTCYGRTSSELAEDTDVEDIIGRTFTNALSWYMDVAFLTGGPFEQLVLGPYLRARFGIRYVIDLRDPWALDLRPPSKLLKRKFYCYVQGILEPMVLRGASQVICANSQFTRMYRGQTLH